jgi:hypothetical protein
MRLCAAFSAQDVAMRIGIDAPDSFLVSTLKI